MLKKSKKLRRKKHLKEETTKNTYSNGYYEYRSHLLVFEKQNSLLSKDFKRFHWNDLKSRNILHPIIRKLYLLSLIVCLSCIQLERPTRVGHNPSEAEYDIEADLKYHWSNQLLSITTILWPLVRSQVHQIIRLMRKTHVFYTRESL